MTEPTEARVHLAATRDIVERIMTQHWDMKACECWVCEDGRDAGCGPRERYLPHRQPMEERRATVMVSWPVPSARGG
jgi:hypothetical protein